MSICQRISFDAYPSYRVGGISHAAPVVVQGSKKVNMQVRICAEDAKALEQKIAGYAHRLDNVTRLGRPEQKQSLSEKLGAWLSSIFK